MFSRPEWEMIAILRLKSAYSRVPQCDKPRTINKSLGGIIPLLNNQRGKNNITGADQCADHKGKAFLLETPKREQGTKTSRLCWPALIALALLLAACEVTPGVDEQASSTNVQSLAAAPELPDTSDIKLEPGDKLHVMVYGEDSITGNYQVDTRGYLALPLAGSVKAAGLTPPELEKALNTRFRKTALHNPKVTVEVMSFRPFYVLGEVQKPGEYSYRAGLNVLSAIAIAGGATYRASTSEVLIQRAGTSTLKKFPQSPSVAVMPGDLVRVPESIF
jgi:protein involved in polysaccharide export with SLBB domain